MFKKANVRILLIAAIALLAVLLISNYLDNKKGERSFKSVLVDLDVSDIDEINYDPDPLSEGSIRLYKEGGAWKASDGANTFDADKASIDAMLQTVSSINAERVAATSKDHWERFELTDSAAIRVQLKKQGDILSDLLIGKFSYKPQASGNPYQQQPQGKMTSFVRLADEETVYAVNGFLKMSFNKDVKSLRNKNLLSLTQNDIQRLEFTSPQGNYSLNRQNGKWMLDGILADSAKAVNYIKTLANLRSSNFVDDYTSTEKPDYLLKIEGENFAAVEIKAFPADTANKYVLNSSQNPDAYFSGAKAGLLERTFIEKEELLSPEEN